LAKKLVVGPTLSVHGKGQFKDPHTGLMWKPKVEVEFTGRIFWKKRGNHKNAKLQEK
jgi:hypothetical protein